MLLSVNPKLPMRDITLTRNFYVDQLGFSDIGSVNYKDYLLIMKDQVEIHFFHFSELNPLENYGMVYIRVQNIDKIYEDFKNRKVAIHPNGKLERKPWGQKEFSILDPDHNLLTFGEAV